MDAERLVEIEADGVRAEGRELALGDALDVEVVEDLVLIRLRSFSGAASRSKPRVVTRQGKARGEVFDGVRSAPPGALRELRQHDPLGAVECGVVEEPVRARSRRRKAHLSCHVRPLGALPWVDVELVPEQTAGRTVRARLVGKRGQQWKGGHEVTAVSSRELHETFEIGEPPDAPRRLRVERVDRREQAPAPLRRCPAKARDRSSQKESLRYGVARPDPEAVVAVRKRRKRKAQDEVISAFDRLFPDDGAGARRPFANALVLEHDGCLDRMGKRAGRKGHRNGKVASVPERGDGREDASGCAQPVRSKRPVRIVGTVELFAKLSQYRDQHLRLRVDPVSVDVVVARLDTASPRQFP